MESKLSENYFQANTGGVDAVVFQVFQVSFFILHKLTLPGITSHQIKTSTELLLCRSAIICAVKIKKHARSKYNLQGDFKATAAMLCTCTQQLLGDRKHHLVFFSPENTNCKNYEPWLIFSLILHFIQLKADVNSHSCF